MASIRAVVLRAAELVSGSDVEILRRADPRERHHDSNQHRDSNSALRRSVRNCLIALSVAGPLLANAAAAEEPVVSAIRYTLEIEIINQRHLATSVVQTTTYPKSRSVPVIGESYKFRYRGEGLGLRFDDGRALVVKFPGHHKPPGYESYNQTSVDRFAAEGKSYPINIDAKRAVLPDAFILDSAIAPTTAWRFDWLHPERTLGSGARIVRFDMRPTRDGPTFELGKTVPWIVIDRREATHQMTAAATEDWQAYHGYRGRLRTSDVKTNASKITSNSARGLVNWLDASDAFSGKADWKTSLVTEVEELPVRYSEDLAEITLLPNEAPTGTATPFVQRTRAPNRHPQFTSDKWTPIVCVDKLGCADVLFVTDYTKRRGALLVPNDELVYVVEHDEFTTANVEFQLDER